MAITRSHNLQTAVASPGRSWRKETVNEKGQSINTGSGRLRHGGNDSNANFGSKAFKQQKYIIVGQNASVWSSRLRSGSQIALSVPGSDNPSKANGSNKNPPILNITKGGSSSKTFRPRNATPIKKSSRSAAQIAGVKKAMETRQRNIQAKKDRAAEFRRQMALLKAQEEALIAAENAPYGNLMIDETTGLKVSLDDQEKKEVDEILSRFFQAGHDYYKVTKIERIVNSKLDLKYEAHRQQLQKKKHPTDEVLMFHGTAHLNIPRIIRQGFKIGGVGGHQAAHGSAQGKGIYTAQSPAGSVGYCTATAGGEYKIIALRCLPGKRRDMYSVPSIHEWKNFDSNHSGGSVIVHRSSAQCLPCYVVHFVYATSYQFQRPPLAKLVTTVQKASEIVVEKVEVDLSFE